MEAEGWPSMQWERFSGETLQAYHRRANEIQQIIEGFRMGRYRGETADQMERRLILQALAKSGGVRTSAAKMLGVTFRSFRYRLAKHALAPDGPESDDD